MSRKVAKLGAVKTDRNGSRSERKLAVSCMGGLLVARVPGCLATSRIHPSRREVAIPHAHATRAKSTKPELRSQRAWTIHDRPGTRATKTEEGEVSERQRRP